LARPGRAADRGGDEHAGGDLVGRRRRARPRRHRRRVGALRSEAVSGAAVAPPVRAQVLLGRALQLDLVPPRRSHLARPLRVRRAAAHRRHARGRPARVRAGLAGAGARAERSRPLVRSRSRGWRRHPRRRLPERALMNEWLTTLLILIPLAGALVIAVIPWPAWWAGSLAALTSLVEVGFWITAAGKFRFGNSSLQLSQRASWFRDLHVQWHVGEYAFSLWLVGMTVVVMAACVIYGWWVGRTRARAYFALMLVLTAAIVGVFTSQDLLLFYAFFEAML